MADLFGGMGDSGGSELIAQQAELAAKNQRLALAQRVRQESEADLDLARRPRAGKGRRLLQYFGETGQTLG